MKIVTNGKGLYSIRKGIWPFYKYFDFVAPGYGYWWKKTNKFYFNCWQSKEKVEAWFGILNPKVAVVILTSNDKHITEKKNGNNNS